MVSIVKENLVLELISCQVSKLVEGKGHIPESKQKTRNVTSAAVVVAA